MQFKLCDLLEPVNVVTAPPKDDTGQQPDKLHREEKFSQLRFSRKDLSFTPNQNLL